MTQQEFHKRFRYDPHTDLVASGGFADVFVAEDLRYEEKYHVHGQPQKPRKVALKIYKLTDEKKYTLVNEVNMAMNLQHPNICRYLERIEIERHDMHNRPETIHVAVMEYLDGGHIDNFVKRYPALIDKLLIDVLQGLAYLHQQNKIHRDIKPSNVLGCFMRLDVQQHYLYEVVPQQYVSDVRSVGRDMGIALKDDVMPRLTEGEYIMPAVKITDFGISKALDAAQGVSTRLFGSKPYMAPEQIDETVFGVPVRNEGGRHVYGIDTRVDIWSFGVMAHELITGQKLFAGIEEQTDEQVRKRILGEDISSKLQQLPAKYRTLLQKCLVRKANDRCGSHYELIALLQVKMERGDDTVIIKKKIEASSGGRYYAYALVSGCIIVPLLMWIGNFMEYNNALQGFVFWAMLLTAPVTISIISFSVAANATFFNKILFFIGAAILSFFGYGFMPALASEENILFYLLIPAGGTIAWYFIMILYKYLLLDEAVNGKWNMLTTLAYTFFFNIVINIVVKGASGLYHASTGGLIMTIVLWQLLYVYNLLKLNAEYVQTSKISK